MGLEDLEGCERFFSKSNALAASTRHASAFHRQQNIVEYLKYIDATETSQNLSMFVFGYQVSFDLIYLQVNFLCKTTGRLFELSLARESWR